MLGRKKKQAPAEDGGTVALRMQALTGDIPQPGVDEKGRATVGMFEMMQGTLVSVVSYADGATSLYLGTGGGIIGLGHHPAVNRESRALITLLEQTRDLLEPTSDFGPFSDNEVRFLLRIGAEVLGVTAQEKDAMSAGHPLHPLWEQGQRVLTELRLHSGR